MSISRRNFARALAGSALALPLVPEIANAESSWPAPPPAAPDEKYWRGIRDRFVVDRKLAPLNAANLCPAPAQVLDALYRATRDIDRDPSPQNRAKFATAKESARSRVAAALHVSADEILLTRNTSEANNVVSAGIDLKHGDQVIVFADNHPSNLNAWRERAKRAGFSVTVLEQPNPHPGAEYFVEAVTKAITSNTKLLSFTHVTSTVGDVLPAAELCHLAREKGVLSLVDGAQSFGAFAVDLSAMQPDFYSGSAHKWPCGAREAGVLYVRKDIQPRVWPHIYSLYPGAAGLSRTHEGFGQRDEAALVALDVALQFQETVGHAVIEQRARQLAQSLIEGLRTLPGVRVWTSNVPERAGPVVSFQPGNAEPRQIAQALYERHGIIVATRGGTDRPGLRVSPHFYNLQSEIDRVISALRQETK